MAQNITKQVDEAADQVVSLLEQAQEATAGVVASVSETVANYLPELGLGELFLSPTDAVDTSYKVSGKFIDASHKAVTSLIEAVSPITDKILGGKKPAAKALKSA